MPGLGLINSAPPISGYAVKSPAAMTNGQTLFTISGGPILVTGLMSVCITANDGTLSTLQYNAVPTIGAAQALSGVSAILASAAPGASIALIGASLATAALLNANGPNQGMTAPLFVPAGTITIVIGVGSTTGTWEHRIYYQVLGNGVNVN